MNLAFPHNRIDYHDVRLFLVLIPVINALNYFLTYTNIAFNAHTLRSYSVDTLQGFLAWWIVRSIIHYLDRRLPYSPNPLRRIIIQLLLTSAAALASIIITTEILNRFYGRGPVPANFYRFDIFIFLIWLFAINGIYIGIYYFKQWNQSEALRRSEKQVRVEGLMVRQGKQEVQVKFEQTAAIFVEGEYAALITDQGKKHLLDYSLDKVEKKLPQEMFFRLNRQYILNRSRITGFERLENGKINVLVRSAEQLPASIQVSRTKAPAFKFWYQGAVA